ncbi:uncharacterized protein SETTUDRAFT_181662 [Exserohilum turcica Et28A]|uniref:Uncharacterized protein n=1 Tax=Exserohilum turcicum (strain 28A) TaxID=671987 RepID=R0I7B0_EXST2|nr:uncharacterized protein SETTUDRAFT_181662 [Exserohilum turcica Et28A]EOA81450.1 hypothetical protein SETTUDRAFT_181662 [Exserohilum turcica Et28A]
MSTTQIPLRTARVPALQRQCLFFRPQYHHHHAARAHNLRLGPPPAALIIPATRAFSSTPPRPKRTSLGNDPSQARAAAEGQVGPSPNVNFAKAQASSDAMIEDIGLLQNTIVRAPISKLKGLGMVDGLRYHWDLLKHKGTGLYGRYYYRACIQKTGWTRFLPVDLFNNSEYTSLAKKYYELIFSNFAKGNIAPIKQICLPPLAKKLESRIAARGPLQLDWHLHGGFKSSRVVSHRAAPLGEDQPDTAFRQVVVRLVSEQSLRTSRLPAKHKHRALRRLPWIPDAARHHAEKLRLRHVKREAEAGAAAADDAAAKLHAEDEKPVLHTVVDYLVLQKRVVRGKEEDWRVWGFTEESTPDVRERDQEYWRLMLDAQTGRA